MLHLVKWYFEGYWPKVSGIMGHKIWDQRAGGKLAEALFNSSIMYRKGWLYSPVHLVKPYYYQVIGIYVIPNLADFVGWLIQQAFKLLPFPIQRLKGSCRYFSTSLPTRTDHVIIVLSMQFQREFPWKPLLLC